MVFATRGSRTTQRLPLLACVLSRIIEGRSEKLQWRRNLDPECGRLQVPVPDQAADWLFERTQRANSYRKTIRSWFNGIEKKTFAKIQYRQAERFNSNSNAELAAARVAGQTYASIANKRKTEEDVIRKAVNAYCERTGLSLSGKPRTAALAESN